MHHVATGLEQLHNIEIAHQDLKPSNVLLFPQDVTKIGDLGRATSRGQDGPHDELKVAGDKGYAPPELLYGQVSADWTKRRLGCDAYLFGSMVVFFFAQAAMTPLIETYLPPDYHCLNWQGPFKEVLPYIREAFGRAVTAFSSAVPSVVRNELTVAVRQLCEPDPERRGHPLNRSGHQNQYSLIRYISLFDLLAKKAEMAYFGKGA